MIYWTSDIANIEALTESMESVRAPLEDQLQSREQVQALCSFCEEVREMRTRLNPDPAVWTDLRGQFVCQTCFLNARSRLLIEALRDEPRNANTLIFERITRFFRYMHGWYGDNITGCEYFGGDTRPGDKVLYRDIEVEHQNMMDLSYADNCFDLVIHSDVLEHVPDYLAGLSQCYRVLKPGGRLVFACPVYCQREHQRVARLNEQGEVEFFGKESYHGNPIDPKGSPVFVKHGYNLLEDLQETGFSRAEIGLGFSPVHAMTSNNNPYAVGLMWPLVFRAVK